MGPDQRKWGVVAGLVDLWQLSWEQSLRTRNGFALRTNPRRRSPLAVRAAWQIRAGGGLVVPDRNRAVRRERSI
jgi:hypothetical protein